MCHGLVYVSDELEPELLQSSKKAKQGYPCNITNIFPIPTYGRQKLLKVPKNSQLPWSHIGLVSSPFRMKSWSIVKLGKIRAGVIGSDAPG